MKKMFRVFVGFVLLTTGAAISASGDKPINRTVALPDNPCCPAPQCPPICPLAH